jgi:hypothetical protein
VRHVVRLRVFVRLQEVGRVLRQADVRLRRPRQRVRRQLLVRVIVRVQELDGLLQVSSFRSPVPPG